MTHTQLLLDVLAALVIADINVLTVLGGYHSSSVCRKKIKQLIDAGLIIKMKSGRGHLLYTLSEKGLSEMGIKRKPYQKNQHTYHEELVGYSAAYLYIVCSISIYDIGFDRTQRNKNKPTEVIDIPDIVYTNDRGKKRCLEVEITLKEKTRLADKLINVTSDYDVVRWVYPDERASIRNSICALMNEYNIKESKCKFTTVQHVIDVVNNFDLKLNKPRYDIKGA